MNDYESNRDDGSYYNPQAGYGPPPPREPAEPYRYNYSDYEQNNDGGKPPKKSKKGLIVFLSIVTAVIAVTLIGFASYGVYVMMSGDNFIHDAAESSSAALPDNTVSSSAPELNIVSPPANGVGTMPDGGMLNEDIAAKVSPSVVRITNSMRDEKTGYAALDEGSGIIMNQEGYIVTNAHVVENTIGLKVTMPGEADGYNASIVGTDARTDIAVIKIEAEPMPPLAVAEFGDSDTLKVGERVIAIGNAGGSEFEGSVTAGIVSALDRQISISDNKFSVIQTDAAINPGNSGGALVDKNGLVVGINSSKYIQSGYEGIGFAIPINTVKPIVDDLIKNGRVTGRVMLGISGTSLNDFAAEARVQLSNPPYNIPTNINGVWVRGIDPEANIARQGVVVGDIITSVAGTAINTVGDIQSILLNYKPGDVIEIEAYRPAANGAGRTFSVQVPLEEDTGESNIVIPQESSSSSSEEEYPSYGGGGNYWPFFPFFY